MSQTCLMEPTFEPWSQPPCGHAVVVLMSGGVDSSVAALLLRDRGWSVVGVTMKVPVASGCSHPAPCCGNEAALVCHKLSIPHYFVDVGQAFHTYIVDPFRKAYAEGRTPNPCVDCNTFLKFGVLWDLIERELGVAHLATGHYARVVREKGQSCLQTAVDRERDQSYFIYGMPCDRLAAFHLPLGGLPKDAVREIARRRALGVEDKPDSMELCFAGEGNYRNALQSDEAAGTGPILDTSGNRLGRHNGIENYTIGQRRGLGIAATEPLYVVRIEAQDNALIVGPRDEGLVTTVRVRKPNVLAMERLVHSVRLQAKVRSHSPPSACRMRAMDADGIIVEFDNSQFAPAPGQHLVLYDQDRLVAGGEIAPL